MDIHLDVPLPGTADQVWEAVATAPGLATWFMAMPFDPDGPIITTYDAPRLLVVDIPGAGPDDGTHFVYEVEPAGDGTAMLHFDHRAPGDETMQAIFIGGWTMYFTTLREYLTHFPDRPATYVEADAGPATSAPEAWPKLLAALGLSAEPVVGDPVEVGLASGPLKGTVDFVSPHFVGIRTDDSLIRFHERSALSMPIAVSHHSYSADADGPAITAAWSGWLGEVA
jgi:hypothetical protein